jgi:hypothetical protein
MTKPRVAWSLVGVGYALLLFAMFWRVPVNHQMAGWDSLEEYWPDLIYQARAYTSGELPLWNPYTLGGYSFHADPQASMLAPGNWVCVLVSPIVGTGPGLMMFKILLLFYAALWGTHVLLYRWTRCHAGAALAAITYCVGAPVLVHKNGALLWPMLYLPWAMVALDAYLDRPSLRRGALLGFAVGATGAAGHPQGFFYALLVLVAFGSARVAVSAVATWRARSETRIGVALVGALKRFGPSGVLALVIAILWLALVYGPAGTVVEESERGVRTMNWVLGNPMHVRGLRELFAPNLDTNWSHDIYMGPLAVVLGAWLAIVSWYGRFWFGLAIGATILAVGSATFVLPILVEHVPGFALFRIPYRYKLITGFACAAGAGFALARLMMSEPTLRDRILIGALSVVWLALAIVFGPSLQLVWGALALAALGAVLVDRARRRVWAALLVAIVAFDLWRANDGKLAILQPIPDADKGMDILAKLPGLETEWRFWATDRWSSHPGKIPFAASYRHDLREISGFEQPLTPLRVIDLLAKAKKTPGVLAHFNVKYYMSRNPGEAKQVPGTSMYTLDDVAPVVRLYPRAELVSAKAQLERLSTTRASALTSALVDPADPRPALPESTFPITDGRVVAFERNRIVVEIDAPERGILVVNEVWAPAWKATIDGAPVELFRANYMLRGVVVPPGKHTIEMTFHARGYRIGFIALLGLLLGFAVLTLLRHKRVDAVLDRA